MENEELEILFDRLQDMLAKRRISELVSELKDMNPADIAILLQRIPIETLPIMFRILPKELAVDTFVEMDPDEQETLIKSFSDTELREVLDELFIDDTVDIIDEMPATIVKRILRNADPDMRRQINEMLQYPPDSAGSVMTIEYVDLKANMTVEDAFKRIRRTGPDKETIYTCYVTDENRKLTGVITAKDLMLAEQDSVIGDIMEENVIYVETGDDREFVAKQIEKYDLLALPVVDREGRLVGIVTVDDAIDVIQEEAEEDFAKMAAMTPIEDGYFKTSAFSHAKNRILWLLILMVSATITGQMLASYESAFAAIPLLVAFLPMLMGAGGNCGSQSSTMVIRGLAVGEFSPKDFLKVLFKELKIGFIVGVVLAVVNTVRIIIQYRDPQIALILALTLIVTALVAKALGCIMPMLAKSLKLDPAIMASPLITTIVDTVTVFIYFNIAMKVLQMN